MTEFLQKIAHASTALSALPPAAPGASTARPRPSRSLVTLGTVLLILSVVAGAAAGAVMGAIGTDSTPEYGRLRVPASISTMAEDVATARDVGHADTGAGRLGPRTSVGGASPSTALVRIAPTDAVTSSLSGVSRDGVTDIAAEPLPREVRHRTGTPSTALSPDHGFRTAPTASGSGADLIRSVEEVDVRFVMVNVDGGAALFGHVLFRFELPGSSQGLAVIGSGAVASVAAGLVVFARRRARCGQL